MLWTWVGIVVLVVLLALLQASKLSDVGFLLSLFLLFGGYGALLASAFFGMPTLWAWGLCTMAGMVGGRLSAERDIPTVEWRARGFHATVLFALALAGAGVTWVVAAVAGEVYLLAVAVYGVLAVWNGLVAVHMAWWVLTNHDGKSTWNYGDGYSADDDYGQHD